LIPAIETLSWRGEGNLRALVGVAVDHFLAALAADFITFRNIASRLVLR
jgi:hypothetical protein